MAELICPRCKKRLQGSAQFCTRCGMTMTPPAPQIAPAYAPNNYGSTYTRTRRPGGIFAMILFVFIFLHGMRACSSIVPVIRMINAPNRVFPAQPQFPYTPSQQNQYQWPR